MSKKILCLVGAGILTILIILGVVGLVTGRLYAGIKKPDQKITITSNVCGDEIINKYNNSTTIFERNKLTDELKSIVSEITGKPGYDSDSSCEFILTKSYMNLNEMDKFKASLDKYRTIVSQGSYPNVKILAVQSADAVQNEAELFWTSNSNPASPTDQSGGG